MGLAVSFSDEYEDPRVLIVDPTDRSVDAHLLTPVRNQKAAPRSLPPGRRHSRTGQSHGYAHVGLAT